MALKLVLLSSNGVEKIQKDSYKIFDTNIKKNLQLYHQLSGRAGRTGKPATVYFQTYNTNTKM